MALHETLGEVLRAFEHGAGLRGANDGHAAELPVMPEVVVDAFHERILGTHHHHVDAFFGHKLRYGVEVVGLDVHVFAYGGGSGVAGGYKKFLGLGALRYFPGQCVFAASAAQ